MPMLKINPEVEIYYEWDGPEIIPTPALGCFTLVNGFSRSSRDFKMLRKRLVAAGFQVLTFDNRGVGKTQCQTPFSLAEMASDVVELWRHLGITQSHLLGISMGGHISQLISNLYPEYVTSLLLISTSYKNLSLRQTAQAPLKNFFSPSTAAKYQLMIDSMTKEVEKNQQDANYQQGLDWQNQSIKAYIESSQTIDFTHPTLIIHGRDDLIIPYQRALELFEMNPRAELVLLPHVGHLLLLEASQQLTQYIIQFTQNC
jgi:3-oxoadipate enol-lactonase